MIDLENNIYNAVVKRLRAEHPGINVSSDSVPSDAKFPAVSIVEADNRVLPSMRTLKIENAVSVMYECNIYSNKAAGQKSEAKSSAGTLDNVFSSIGFTRTMKNQVPNYNDARIYRIVCRYEAVIDKDFWIYHN